MTWIQPIAEPNPSPSHTLEVSNNLATDHTMARDNWATQTSPLAPPSIPDMGVVANLKSSGRLSCAASSRLNSSLEFSAAAPGLVGSISVTQIHGAPASAAQINLATDSNFGNGIEHNESQFFNPFSTSFVQNVYQPFADTSSDTSPASAEIAISPGYTYRYSQSPQSAQSSNGIALGYDDFQSQGLGEQPFDTNAIAELCLEDDHVSPFVREQPQGSRCSGTDFNQNSSALILQDSQPQHTYIVSFHGMPLGEDKWSGTAFSSPSLASFRSSPVERHDSSALGTPSLEFDDVSSPVEPPPSISYSAPESRRPSSSPSCLPSMGERRGAISQQGSLESYFPHIFTGFDFDIDNNRLHTAFNDDCSTPALSPSTSQEPEYPFEAAAPIRPSLAMAKVDSIPLSRRPSSKSESAARGQNGGSRHHPYGRTTKMSAHEQVIEFGPPFSDVSDDREPGARKSRRKSKAPRRCYCDYVCPVKGEPCGQSVSREADMSRHRQRHRRAELDMIRDGVLLPERQTNFDDLKPSEEIVCKGCGESISRKDAFKRHLKNTGKACRPYYPHIVIADD